MAAVQNESRYDERNSLPPLKGLSFLDRFLVLWVILAMGIGIILGNFVPSTTSSLQKGQLVGVSIPIGEYILKVLVLSSQA